MSVVDPSDAPVTDFEEIRAEHRREGTQTWGTVPLAHTGGGVYQGEYVFESSGDYDIRVVGIRPSDAEVKILHQAAVPLEVVRAHGSAGGYRVDFESFPGHIHAGESSTLTFWFSEVAGGGGHGAAPAQVTGLAPSIFVGVDGAQGSYTGVETESGVYTATHSFTIAATVPVTIRFTGQDQQEYDYTVPIIIHPPH